MEGILIFDTIAEAMSKGRQAVKGNFTLEGDPDKEERNYTRTFNSNWTGKGHTLSNQLAKFLAASYRAHGLTDQELKVDPSLSVTQEIVSCWRQITMTLHPEFVHQVTGVTEKLFSNPEIKAELTAQLRKRRHNTQLSVFNRLQTAAIRKLEKLDEFLGLQVDVCYEEFKQRVKGVEFSRLLREGHYN